MQFLCSAAEECNKVQDYKTGGLIQVYWKQYIKTLHNTGLHLLGFILHSMLV